MTSDGAGGVGIHAQTLAAALRARGHRVTLAPVGAGGASGGVALPGPIEWDSTQPVARLEAAVAAGRRRLAAYAGGHGVDLVHCNQFAWVQSVPGVPSLLAVHSDAVSWWRAVRGTPPPPSPFSRWYERLACRALRQAEVVVTPSAAARADLRASFGWDGGGEVIFNGWEAEDTPAASLRAGAVSVGRLWDEGKQASLLMRPDLPCPTVMAGDDGGRCWPAMPNLRQAGKLSHAEVLRLFARGLIYVAPSRYEPFGLAPLEAAASGCCLLLNDLASFREIWGTAAYYFARNDGDDLVAWLRRLVAEPALTRRGAQAAAERARQLGSAPMAAAYDTLYTRVMVAA